MIKKKFSETKTLVVDVWELTPVSVKWLFKSKLTGAIALLCIGAIARDLIRNSFFNHAIPWLQGKTDVQNWFILLAILSFAFSLSCLYFLFALNESRMLLKDNALASSSADSLEGGFVFFESGNPSVHKNSDGFYPTLTQIVTSSPAKLDLIVSIGEGDFIKGWLARIYEDSRSGRGARPNIRKIQIKHLSEGLCQNLEDLGWIERGYYKRMQANIRYLQRQLAKEPLSIELTEWNTLPPWHGFIVAGKLFFNYWNVDSGSLLHVRTSLYECSAEEYPELFARAIDQFESA